MGSIDFYIEGWEVWGGKKHCFDVGVVGDHWVIQNPGTGRSAVFVFPPLCYPPSILPDFSFPFHFPLHSLPFPLRLFFFFSFFSFQFFVFPVLLFDGGS